MQKIAPPSANPPVPASDQHRGFLQRILHWFSGEFKSIDTTVSHDIHALLANKLFDEVESVGVSILEVIGQIYLNNIMMQGPVGAEESESRFKRFAGSAAGQSLVMGGLNVAGSIPSLGQMTNLGSAAEGIVNNLGMGYMNYQMMKPVMEQTTNNPLEAKYRESAQSNTLNEGQVTAAYERGLVSEGEMDSQLKELGYREDFHPVVKELNRNVPDVATLQQMYDSKAINESQLTTYLRQNGYTDTSINHISSSIRNTPVNNYTKEITDAINQLVANEHITDSQFTDMMKALNINEQESNRIMLAVKANNTVKGLQQEINLLTDLYRQGKLSQDSLTKQLSDLGMEEVNVTKLIETETQSIMKSNPIQRIVTLDEHLAQGLLNEQSYMSELKKIGLTEEESVAKLITQQDKINKNLGTTLSKGNLNQTNINLAYAEGTIDESQFRALSYQVGTTSEVIDTLITSLRHMQTASVKPIPLDIINQGILNKTLDVEKATNLIVANGYSPSTAATIVEVFSKSASSQVGTAGDATGGGLGSTSGHTGRDIESINPNRYIAQMTTMGVDHSGQMSLVAMFYNSLIQGGYITMVQAVQLMEALGMTQNEAEVLLQ